VFQEDSGSSDGDLQEEASMRTLLGPLIAGLVILAGCGDADRPRGESGAVATDAPGGPSAKSGGAIVLEVKYRGEAMIETVTINKDVEQCGEKKSVVRVAVGPGNGLRDAIVSVVDVQAGAIAKPAAKPVLDQKGCEFQPHVLGMMPGEVDILNSDGILHNIRTFSTANASINKAQPRFKKVMTETFGEPEIIRVQCDVHSWMQGWIVVKPHPFFAVTSDAGKARIENVPSGKHTVEVWHPVLGKQSREVEAKAGETVTVAFEMRK
jgi:plastocyanin